jgi:hypothetical protein
VFCTQCGANNADNAIVCVQCGRNLEPTAPPPLQASGVVLPPVASAPGYSVPNYLAFAILVTIFCCLPTGIPAIVFAAQVNGKLQAGDVAGAQAASKNAKMWCWISFGLGLATGLLYMLVIGAGLIRQIGSH